MHFLPGQQGEKMRRQVKKSTMISVELQIPAEVVEQLQQMTGIADASEAVKSVVKQWHEEHSATAAPLAAPAPASYPKPRHKASSVRHGDHPATAPRSSRPEHKVPSGNSRQTPQASSTESPTAGREEHPIKAYQRRLHEEEMHKQNVRRGGNMNRSEGGRPANRSAANRPTAGNSTPGNNRYESNSASSRPPRQPRQPRAK